MKRDADSVAEGLLEAEPVPKESESLPSLKTAEEGSLLPRFWESLGGDGFIGCAF
ncbi:MAG: hypothetical protein IKD31_05195 [Clostridia bacterium]|nr:hypothetical protein [Clostridia bacterium]